MTSHCFQVNGPVLATKASIATVDLEMRVGEQAVGTTTDINRVGNVERADQRGYVTPRLWTDSMFLPQM